MNRIRRICRYLAGVTRCTGVLPAYGGAAATTLAAIWPDPPWFMHLHIHIPPHARLHRMASGGMPGWQITLIAVGATVLAAAVVTLLARARAARRSTASAA